MVSQDVRRAARGGLAETGVHAVDAGERDPAPHGREEDVAEALLRYDDGRAVPVARRGEAHVLAEKVDQLTYRVDGEEAGGEAEGERRAGY